MTDEDKGILVWSAILLGIFGYCCYLMPAILYFFIGAIVFFAFFGLIGGN